MKVAVNSGTVNFCIISLHRSFSVKPGKLEKLENELSFFLNTNRFEFIFLGLNNPSLFSQDQPKNLIINLTYHVKIFNGS